MKVGRDRKIGVSNSLRGTFLSAVLICAIPGFAQQPGTGSPAASSSISGNVTAITGQGTANKLAGITVTLTAAAPGSVPQTAVTNSEGRYEFTHLAPGRYILEGMVAGFKPWTAEVTLGPKQVATVEVALQISSLEARVEVHGEATEVATQSVSAAATVSERQLQTLPLRTEKFTEALSVSPGVIQTHEGKLNFNGQSESQGMLLLDSTENVDPVTGSFAVPVPVNRIQTMRVFSTPDSAAYGGFSGGLTTIEITPPASAWSYKFLDLVPSFRGKNDHIIGLLNMTPGVEFGGPLIKNKLNFSQTLTYEFRKDPVHGLSWPVNETVTYSLLSFTQLQYTFSSKHLLNVNLNVFPSTVLYANINALIPQIASANFRRRGLSLGISDSRQFISGMTLTTDFRYTNFYATERGQGPAEMTINPEGWGGNYFNAFWRNANQVEVLPILRLPTKGWHGQHEVQFGTDVLYRSYTGSSVSHPIRLLAQDGTVAETIDFQGAGRTHAADTEIAAYAEDRWTFTKSLSLDVGGRLTHQTIGRDFAFAPRAGLAYSMAGGKMVVRAGTGLIFGQVPLLAANFSGNQERVVTFSSGPLAGEPVTLQNVYQTSGSAGTFQSVLNDNSSPRTFTWNIESQIALRNDLSLRLGYFETHTINLFVVNPILPTAGTTGFLALANTGSSDYREAELTARYRPSERAELNVSYAWSRARGDLNTISEIFIPIAAPVIRPNAYGVPLSDVPHRVITWGDVTLPRKFVLSPVMDIHSGFPYSNVDVLQNYVGEPDHLRFPFYFSLDVKLSRVFTVHNPFNEHAKPYKVLIGVFSLDVTNRLNPHDVFNNVTAPLFGQFAGFQRRLTGLDIELSQ